VAAARDEFSIGRRTLIEVLDAQRDFVRAQETVVSAQSEKIRTGYQALALTGDIIEAFAITLPSDEAFQ
jgi:adhesin transport system outer membrane protein